MRLDKNVYLAYNFKKAVKFLADFRLIFIETPGGENMEDREIIRLFFKRNEAALNEVSRKYGSHCRAIARNILKNYEEAEECVNDTYMRVWESIPPNDPPVLGAFLSKITKNLALSRVAFFNAEKRGGGNEALSFDELDEFVSGEYSVEAESDRKELIAVINRFLKKLPAKQRQIFIGRYWGYYKLSELAKRFGMSESGVSVSLERTRRKLKKHLEKGGFIV